MVAAITVVWRVFGALWRKKKVGAILVLVGWASLADIFWAARFIASDAHRVPDRGPVCTFIGVVGQVMGAVLVSTNFVIGVDVLLCERFPFTHSSARCLPRYQAWVVFVAVATASWVGAIDCYGPSPDGTCWIELDSPGGRCTSAFRAQNYITVTYVVFCTLVMLFFAANNFPPAVRYCRSRSSSGSSSGRSGAGQRRLVQRMATFTGTFLFIWMPFSVFFLARELGISTAAKDALQKFTSLTIPLTGFFNWLVWRQPLRALSHGAANDCCRLGKRLPPFAVLLLSCPCSCRSGAAAAGGDGGSSAVRVQLVEDVENPGVDAHADAAAAVGTATTATQ
jgi:hypothetical protein